MYKLEQKQKDLRLNNLNNKSTRWTFFRVQLVFQCDFEISWSSGLWDLGTLGPPPPPPHTSFYLLPSLPPTLLLCNGLVIGRGEL